MQFEFWQLFSSFHDLIFNQKIRKEPFKFKLLNYGYNFSVGSFQGERTKMENFGEFATYL